jgi:carbamoyltransferase
MSASYVLGISCYYHDSAAALIHNGEILGAVQEERFTRKKHDPGFPTQSIQYLIRQFNLNAEDIESVVYYEKPFITFERLIETHLNAAPFGLKPFLASMPIWIKEKLFLDRDIRKQMKAILGKNCPPVKYSEHHLSHASSAFYPSPFEEAAVLCVDGVGEWATSSAWIGNKSDLRPLWEIHFPHSLGLFYSAITGYLGFKVNSGEYKVMGLAPYGEPKYADLMLKELIILHADGSYSLNMKYFAYDKRLRMFNSDLEDLLGRKARLPETQLDQFHMDVAASLQVTLENALFHLVGHLQKKTGLENLCLAGGVALNCVANSKLFEKTGFKKIWVQPSAGDAGGALGAGLAYSHLGLKIERAISPEDSQKGSYLGPDFKDSEIENFLTSNNIPYEKLSQEEMINLTCSHLEHKKVIGWFQGRMEFGPRALGHRSIIGDARVLDLQKTMNLKIKYRESFRPFAPIVLAEESPAIFEFEHESPYMLFVAPIKNEHRLNMSDSDNQKFGIDKLNVVRSQYPAITHVDYSARLQTVTENRNPILHGLLKKFRDRNKTSVLVNTSFNVRGEPIVCSPEDAYRCFRRTEIDTLVLGNYVVSKEMNLPPMKDSDWKNEYELD